MNLDKQVTETFINEATEYVKSQKKLTTTVRKGLEEMTPVMQEFLLVAKMVMEKETAKAHNPAQDRIEQAEVLCAEARARTEQAEADKAEAAAQLSALKLECIQKAKEAKEAAKDSDAGLHLNFAERLTKLERGY